MTTIFINIERRDPHYPEGTSREPGDMGNSSLQLKGNYLQVLGNLPHNCLIRPTNETERMAMIRWLVSLDYANEPDFTPGVM